MREFIVLSLLALAYADKFGYNYRPVEHSRSGLSFIPGSLTSGISSSRNSLTSSSNSNSLTASASHNTPAKYGGYETEFYTFTAPEDVFDDNAEIQKIAASLKKKVRVIFIKNPENTAYENAVLALAKQVAEQRTAIYVLNKQHDISDLATKLESVHNYHNSKPEVHFVKYRTPEDAVNAQRDIQSQYDSLGGSSQIYNEGRAPVLSFVSPVSKISHGTFQTSNSEYLPPSGFGGFRV